MRPQRRFTERLPLGPERVIGLDPYHPAVVTKRTLFPTTVVSADKSPRLLVSGANQRKIGDRVAKGEWSGMPMFTLTLEERATCPECPNTLVCMGNGMQLARRHKSGPELEKVLWRELIENGV